MFNISNCNYIKFTLLIADLPIGHVRLILHELNQLKDPNTTKNVKEDICKDVNMAQSFPELYKYQSPMEKQLTKLTEQITEKEEQIKKLKHEIHEVESFRRDLQSHLDLGSSCRKCHQRVGHKSSYCTLEQCTTFCQCGQLNLHKNKKKLFKTKRGKLKKLIHFRVKVSI